VHSSPFETLEFTHRFLDALPGDPIPENFVRQVQGCGYSMAAPTPVRAPQLVSYIPEMVESLGLSRDAVKHPDFLSVLAGNRIETTMHPHATCYGGHQFGHWAGQLGDGRAINLGEVRTPDHQFLTLQLKGAGRTPYSRSADGRAVLRSSLREYVCSEAMHHLGIPTTRSLSLVLTGDPVMRDMFYDGNARTEPGAIVCRVAQSFTRFGHFELPAARGDIDLLKQWVHYSQRFEFGGIYSADPEGYAAWFEDIAIRTAKLMVDWQRVGFVHGVMNTDNLSVLGLTIDYGPYGWLEGYDPFWTPNTTDAEGRRYAYGQQPAIARWNLIRLANAIYPLIGTPVPLEQAIERFDQHYASGYLTAFSSKIGILDIKDSTAPRLISSALELLSLRETDFTLFFRGLSTWDSSEIKSHPERAPLFMSKAWYDTSPPSESTRQKVCEWFTAYAKKLQDEDTPPDERKRQMESVNPRYVFRNYLAQQAIDEVETGGTAILERLLRTLKRPYDDQPEQSDLAQKRPEWARHKAGCSMLSCSS
jgi:serine/tyrosine/threonine adenylyltransferase